MDVTVWQEEDFTDADIISGRFIISVVVDSAEVSAEDTEEAA